MVKTETKTKLSLKDCFEKQILIKKEAGKNRTAGNYASALNKFISYAGLSKVQKMSLEDLTPEAVQQYLLWLLQDEDDGNAFLAPGSQDFYFRNLKAMYNKSIRDQRYTPPLGNPFKNLHIQVPPTRKRALSNKELLKLSQLDYSHEPDKFAALHLALFLFYARGMCFIDAFNLKMDNLNGNYIHYTRSKTGVALQVKITPEMMNIIRIYYRKDSNWLFPFLHDKVRGKGPITAQSSLHRVNECLKEIGDKMGYLQPLTTYVLRHSWASMMLEAGIEVSVISQAMGHTSLRTTEIYLNQLSISKMDRATDKMLDNMLRKYDNKKKARSSLNKKKSHSPIEMLGMRCKFMFMSIAKMFAII